MERNRELVLNAAREVFLERGYAGATLEAIAEAAGFSKGVVYSQFAGKPDLFLALLERRIDQRAAENAALAAGYAGSDGLRALMRTNARHSVEGRDWSRLLIEFRVLAARDAELNRRYAALHSRTMDQFADAVGGVLSRGDLAAVYPVRILTELIFALDVGWVLEQAAGTAQVGLDVVEDLVVRLVQPR